MKEELEKLNTLQLKKIVRLTYHLDFDALKEKTKDELVAMLLSPKADVKSYGEASVLTLIQSFSRFGPWQQTEEEAKKEEDARLLQWAGIYSTISKMLEDVVLEKMTIKEVVRVIAISRNKAREDDNSSLEEFYTAVLDML